MIRILITGINSNTGNAFAEYVREFYPNEFAIERCSLRDDNYLSMNWGNYDVVLHTVGVAGLHGSAGSLEEKEYCYGINRDLTLRVAKKAKCDGIKHFVFLSTMMVYGESAPIGSHYNIDEKTIPSPISYYGKSKLAGERELSRLEDELFNITIIREPVVYGEHFKGEFYKLQKIAKKVILFPLIESTKSYVYEGNLCEAICQVIQKGCYGIIHPQNAEMITTSELYSRMVSSNGKKCILIRGLKGILRVLSFFTKYVNAVFNDMNYSAELSKISGVDYQVFSLEESINRCQI